MKGLRAIRDLIMKLFRTLILITGLFIALSCSCEKNVPGDKSDNGHYYRFAFYNVENLFDTINNPVSNDEEFTPGSEKQWDTKKYYDKLGKISGVIKDLGGDDFPALVGLCEVENLHVLEGLAMSKGLKNAGYQIIHKESPDYRGIDVALMFRPDIIRLLNYKAWPVWFPFDNNYSTREILYACFDIQGKDSLHVFVNHWPSRSGGEVESRPRRIFVAEMLRSKVDSLLSMDPDAKIIITGDFNDEPTDLSLVSGLTALTTFDDPGNDRLYNLSYNLKKNSSTGSYKFRGDWNMLDQFIVSGSMLDTSGNIYSRKSDVHIFVKDYLLERDENFMGVKPYRTWLGDYHHGGYSDHLPVYLDIRYRTGK
jgi:predicted extracellular nuclease